LTINGRFIEGTELTKKARPETFSAAQARYNDSTASRSDALWGSTSRKHKPIDDHARLAFRDVDPHSVGLLRRPTVESGGRIPQPRFAHCVFRFVISVSLWRDALWLGGAG
jgi:hypothetical protein